MTSLFCVVGSQNTTLCFWCNSTSPSFVGCWFASVRHCLLFLLSASHWHSFRSQLWSFTSEHTISMPWFSPFDVPVHFPGIVLTFFTNIQSVRFLENETTPADKERLLLCMGNTKGFENGYLLYVTFVHLYLVVIWLRNFARFFSRPPSFKCSSRTLQFQVSLHWLAILVALLLLALARDNSMSVSTGLFLPLRVHVVVSQTPLSTILIIRHHWKFFVSLRNGEKQLKSLI